MVLYPLERPLQKSVLVILVVFSTLAVLSVVLRIVGRVKLGRWLDGSDYFMVASCFCMLALAGAIGDAIFHAGLGFHSSEISGRFGVTTGAEDISKRLLIFRIAAFLSLALSKISLLVLCLRVFTSKTLHLIANLTIGFVTLWCIASVIVSLKICTPFEFLWNRTIDGQCGPENLVFTILAVINIIAILIVLFLPMPYIYRLQLATYKKVTLMVTFGLGFLVCIASIVKTAILPSVDFTDVTYTSQYTVILTHLEVTLAIIVATIPVLRPLFKNSLAVRAANAHKNGNHNSRYYSAVPPTGTGLGGSANGKGGFSDLRNLIASGGRDRGTTVDEEQPLPMRPEKTYYNRIEAGGRGSCDSSRRDDMELGGMGGITVKTEFTASVEVVEVLKKAGSSSVGKFQRGPV